MRFEYWVKSAGRAALSALLAFVCFMHFSSVTQAGTLEDVRARGYLKCGVSEGLVGFSAKDKKGIWRGFDVDFCRALAAAIFGSTNKVKYSSLTAEQRFDALTKGEIDVLSRNTTWTMSRDVGQALEFIGVIYYDGQGFMVRREDGLSSALQLSGARVCVLAGTTTQKNAQGYFARHKIQAQVISFDSRAKLLEAYKTRKCDAYSADSSALASERAKLSVSDDQDRKSVV